VTTERSQSGAAASHVSDAADTGATLEVAGLQCERGDRILFRDLSFSVQAGGVVQLEGRNGSGKTTLLRVLCGLTQPVEGDVLWCGQPIGEQRADYQAQVSYLGHLPGVKRELTPLENLAAVAAIGGGRRGMSGWDALERVGLAGLEYVACGRLSAGQRQRVALARLLLRRTPIWLLDEPFTALDRSGCDLVEELLAGHCVEGGMAVISTHRPLAHKHPGMTRLGLMS
jgi:heme exporter protein A